MTAAELLGELRRRGIEVIVRDGRLLLRDRSGALGPELRNRVARNHAGLLEILSARSHPCTVCGRFRFPAPTVCYWCRRRGAAAIPKFPAEFPAATPARPKARACPSCGGGLQPADPDGAACWSCRRLRTEGRV